MNGASKELASYVTTARFQDLAVDIVARVKDLMLDHLGVSIFGSTAPWARMVTSLVTGEGNTGASSIYLSGRKSIARSAALANGTMAHAFELDDTLPPFHPGAVIMAAALAVGEQEHSTGRDLIMAIVLGYEVMGRIGPAIHGSRLFHVGHHPTGVAGSIGAAATAGKLLNLDAKKLVSALGLAANQHTGLMEFFREGTMEKRLFPGKASHDGLFSALLAARGFTAAGSSLDGEYGFCRVFDREADPRLLTRNLGKTFRLMDTGIKPYACIRTIHGQIDCALKIADMYHLLPQDIREVVVYGSKSLASDQHAFYEIRDITAAQYSVPYCIARAFVHHNVWVDDFSPQAMSDPQTLTLMRRIKVVYDSEFERNKALARISVRLANDKDITETTHGVRGSPDHPSFTEDLHNKFRSLALMVLPEARVESLKRLVQKLDTLGDTAELADAMGSRQ